MQSSTLTPILKVLQALMHISFIILLGFATYFGARENIDFSTSIAVIGFTIFLMYLAGVYLEFRKASKTKVVVWILTLTVLWAVMSSLTPLVTYMVVPLIMLQLHVLETKTGIALSLVSTLFTIATLLMLKGYSFSDVLGPALVSIIALVVGMSARSMQDEVKNHQNLLEELMSTQEDSMRHERALAVETERTRVAREIHDTLAQGLSSIVMLTNSMDHENLAENTRKKVELINATAKENLKEARGIIKELSPSPLSQQTLEAALQRICATSLVPMKCVVATSKLSRSIETVILRMSQSLLANVAQHSQATHADLILKTAGNTVTLIVHDNGVGFDEAEKGFGLNSLEQRVNELGGQFTIDSSSQGTTVRVVLPLEEDVDGNN